MLSKQIRKIANELTKKALYGQYTITYAPDMSTDTEAMIEVLSELTIDDYLEKDGNLIVRYDDKKQQRLAETEFHARNISYVDADDLVTASKKRTSHQD